MKRFGTGAAASSNEGRLYVLSNLRVAANVRVNSTNEGRAARTHDRPGCQRELYRISTKAGVYGEVIACDDCRRLAWPAGAVILLFLSAPARNVVWNVLDRTSLPSCWGILRLFLSEIGGNREALDVNRQGSKQHIVNPGDPEPLRSNPGEDFHGRAILSRHLGPKFSGQFSF